MYIEQLKNKKYSLGSYIPIPLGFILLMFFNFLMSDGVDTNEVIQQTIKMIGVNLTFVALVGPLAFGLLIVLFWVKFVQGQSITSLTTSRQKIDWKRVFFSFFLWGSITTLMILTLYFTQPENFVWNFNPEKFFIFLVLAVVLVPMQTSFEEYLFRGHMMQGIGLAVLFVGISGAMTGMLKISKSIIESTGSLILVLSLCFGALIGEFINIEKRIEQFGFYLKSKVKSNDSKFIEGFVSTSLVICVGAMAIVGSFQDGLLHDPSILISKAVMDFVIVMVFASTLGVGTIFSAIPIFVYQGLLTVCASFLAPYFTTTMISNISFVGSVLIFAVGTNLCFHTKIKVGNLLPAVFMPLLLALFM